ncbi:hypothetical protein DFH29DRAFT_879193 [Suillus ampliporus]|nr:hypothetical protein DFH29DRAFT_879193 [Suillus ampliporus]
MKDHKQVAKGHTQARKKKRQRQKLSRDGERGKVWQERAGKTAREEGRGRAAGKTAIGDGRKSSVQGKVREEAPGNHNRRGQGTLQGKQVGQLRVEREEEEDGGMQSRVEVLIWGKEESQGSGFSFLASSPLLPADPTSIINHDAQPGMMQLPDRLYIILSPTATPIPHQSVIPVHLPIFTFGTVTTALFRYYEILASAKGMLKILYIRWRS